jgi:K+-sensing histidine kinase KdpD
MKIDQPASWVVSVLHDITASENLDRLRDQFLAAAAHSLKTPVAVIKADAQALLPVVPQPHQSLAASLERQSNRLDRLVQNLMVLARARSHALELYPTEIELEPLLEGVARESTWSYRHEVRAEVTNAPRVYADAERLRLVVRNLMQEACRLSPPGTRVTLKASRQGNRVMLGVRYQPLPSHERVSAYYDDYDEIGIGRSVTGTIVASHGGTLSEDVTSSQADIWIYLPALEGATS